MIRSLNVPVHCGALSLALVLGGCVADEVVEAPQENRCQQIIDHMAECYPDLASEADCTEQTIAQFDAMGLSTESCGGIDDIGKADLFAFGGCPTGEHVCGWIFCCDDYELTWFPKSDEDWNIVSVVQGFQSAAPADAIDELEQASWNELLNGVSVSFIQDVAEVAGGPQREMAVEITQQVVQVPYDEFVDKLAAQDWGINLDHYLGGEVRVYETDAQGRATRQLERMVLSPFPCDWESALSNNDMTKVEVIEYGESWATVFWRVMHSNNNSTETDVGSVDFWGIDDEHTLITFHSAHRLNAPGGIHIPNSLLAPVLSTTFLDFVRHYRELVED